VGLLSPWAISLRIGFLSAISEIINRKRCATKVVKEDETCIIADGGLLFALAVVSCADQQQREEQWKI